MKKKKTVWLLAVLMFFSSMYSGCANFTSSAGAAEVSYPTVSCNANGITLQIDPRIELLSIIEYLSTKFQKNYPEELSPYSASYKKEVEEYFSEYRNHKAVQYMDQLAEQYYFDPDGALTLMIYITDSFDLSSEIKAFSTSSGDTMESQSYDTMSAVFHAFNNYQNIEAFVKELKDFAKKSDFSTFLKNHYEYYDTIVNGVAGLIRSDDKTTLETYIGSSQSSYTLIFSPMQSSKAKRTCIYNSYALDLFEIFGPLSNEKFLDRETMRDLIWYEFGHSFIDPLTEVNHASMMSYQKEAYPQIKEAMKDVGCDNWQDAVNEHVIRGIGARMIFKQNGQEAFEAFMKKQRDQGFSYIDSVTGYLTYFEHHRSKYGTLTVFYPDLMKAFQSTSAQIGL